MLMSGLFGEDLFDEFWGLPTQRELANIDKHLYGKNARNLMKTDVHETDTDYEMDVDLPGFKKDQINVKLEDGYMTISATKDHDTETTTARSSVRKDMPAACSEASMSVMPLRSKMLRPNSKTAY